MAWAPADPSLYEPVHKVQRAETPPMPSDYAAMLRQCAASLHVMAGQIAQLQSDVADLQSQILGMKANPAPVYRGIWRQQRYAKSELVTCDGSLWSCLRDTDAKPGADGHGWQLCAKSSRAPTGVATPRAKP